MQEIRLERVYLRVVDGVRSATTNKALAMSQPGVVQVAAGVVVGDKAIVVGNARIVDLVGDACPE